MSAPLLLEANSLIALHSAVKSASFALRGNLSVDDKEQIQQPLWFRGHSKNTYLLRPHLYPRKAEDKVTYAQMRLHESQRRQHFSARAYHIIAEKPHTDIEWLSVMQHYWVHTRLLDWGESLYSALFFALKTWISNPEENEFRYGRKDTTPTIWLLNPCKLNNAVYDHVSGPRYPSVVDCAIEKSILPDDRLRKKMMPEALRANRNTLLADEKFGRGAIVSLSRLEEFRDTAGARYIDMLRNGEANVFYYLLLRIYSDGAKLPIPIPPLAILNPYHSPRIAAQRGAFTIFPFPANMDAVSGMEDFDDSGDWLAEIRIKNPKTVAAELRDTGFSRTDTFPELPEFGKGVEWR